MNIMNDNMIVDKLFLMRDEKYAAFQAKLIPTIHPNRIIGVRTPELRALAKTLINENDSDLFLSSLPHKYFEENQLHAFMISLETDFTKCIAKVKAFLPFIDNWATCDQTLPMAFIKEPEKLLPDICKWLKSDKIYTVRFAIGLLMRHFLGENFKPEYADMVASLRSGEYYVNMMIAWYFATALAKQYDLIIPYLEAKKLDNWAHNKAIQKSLESYRISPERKEYLKTLKI